jgi:hypothetical protein
MFRKIFIFYGEGLLAPCPTPKLEDHPFSIRGAYSIYLQLTSIAAGLPSIHDPRTRPAVVAGNHLTWGCEV